MAAIRSTVRAIPGPLRRGMVRLADRWVPRRWQLPYTSAKLRLQGALEEEIGWLPRILRGRGGIAIDVGANIGLYSYHLAGLCDWVEAFEPNSACLEVLSSYGAKNVHPHCVALSARAGMRMLKIPVTDGVPQSGFGSIQEHDLHERISIEVTTHTLDEYGYTQAKFVKIDVEGHELEVLEGATETIRRCMPVLLIEIEERHQNIEIDVVFEHVLKRGYQGYFIFEQALHSLDQFRVDFHQRGYVEGRQTTKYVNNFIFLPRGQRIDATSAREALRR